METFHALSFVFGSVVTSTIIFSYLYGKTKGYEEVEREYEHD